ESIHQNHFYSVERNSAGISDDVKLTARVTNWGPNTNELVVVTVSIPNRTLVLSKYPSFLPAGCSQSDVGSTGLSITCKPFVLKPNEARFFDFDFETDFGPVFDDATAKKLEQGLSMKAVGMSPNRDPNRLNN